MDNKEKKLLIVDGIINLILGILLLCFPLGMASLLGLPPASTFFYPSILGAVLFGIGIALFIDALGEPHGIRGLGITGAITINFCGAGVLSLWLIFIPMSMPLRGYVILWSIAVLVFVIGGIELKNLKLRKNHGSTGQGRKK